MLLTVIATAKMEYQAAWVNYILSQLHNLLYYYSYYYIIVYENANSIFIQGRTCSFCRALNKAAQQDVQLSTKLITRFIRHFIYHLTP